jgi:predicted dehydrogenase
MTARTTTGEHLNAAVIGVGKMGAQHARVYSELPGVTLAGVADADPERAASVADRYDTTANDRDTLLSRVDVASVAVPTAYHYETAQECIDRGVDVLVEKPFVDDLSKGRELAARAREAGVIIQVGHVEEFNPAVRVLSDIVPDLEVVAIDVQRLGPPVDRAITDNVVFDLMVHDIGIMLSLIDSEIDHLSAAARDGRHVTAQFQFLDHSVAVLTASRLTQERVRRLSVTAMECRVNVDFLAQSVEIHRRSLPEYVETDGDVRYRQESVVERPMVENGEPLKNELTSFLTAVRRDEEPLVSAEDALRVLEVAQQVENSAFQRIPEVVS